MANKKPPPGPGIPTSIRLPVFRMDDLNRILKDPVADPAAAARALLWIPNLFEDLPPCTHLIPGAIPRPELRRLDPQQVPPCPSDPPMDDDASWPDGTLDLDHDPEPFGQRSALSISRSSWRAFGRSEDPCGPVRLRYDNSLTNPSSG